MCLLEVLKNHFGGRLSDVTRCRKPIRTHFLHLDQRKKRLRRSSLSDVLRRRMALRTYNLPAERLKMPYWWCRWSVFSWRREAFRKHVLHSGRPKSRFWRNGWSEWCRNLISTSWTSLKTTFGEVGEAKFHDVGNHSNEFYTFWAFEKAISTK
jgi:hypothetical protein